MRPEYDFRKGTIELINDMVESVQSNIKERISSPFLGAFTISVLLTNWKLLVILFTSEKNGMDLVEVMSSVMLPMEKSLFLPLGIAFITCIAYPVITALISIINVLSKMIQLKADRIHKFLTRIYG